MSPTARSLKALRDDGWLVGVVERWIPHAKIRKDLFGLIDILAIKDGKIRAVQATDGSNVSARVKKAKEHENLAQVSRAFDFVIHGWRKNAAGRWVCREVRL